MSVIRIALDGMGGDFAPQNPAEGARYALDALPADIHIILVGKKQELEPLISRSGYDASRLSLVHADNVISMATHDVAQILASQNSSIHVCMDLLKKGEVDAVVSAGNTSAITTVAFRKLKRLPGVSRLALAATFPSLQGPSIMLDVGATPDCTPENLFQFAIMGAMYEEHVLGVPNPRIALMNIGEEPTKGSRLTIEAYHLLCELKTNGMAFIGNVEGNDVFRGRAQVIVFDGLTGNVILKFAESILPTLKGFISKQLGTGRKDQQAFALAAKYTLGPTIGALRRTLSADDYGGAPILGVNGTVIVAHGKSTPAAIVSAVRAARQAVLNRLSFIIGEHLARYTSSSNSPVTG